MGRTACRIFKRSRKKNPCKPSAWEVTICSRETVAPTGAKNEWHLSA